MTQIGKNPADKTQRVAQEGVEGFRASTDDELRDLDVYEALIDMDSHQRRSDDDKGGGRGAMPPAAVGGQGAAGSGAGAAGTGAGVPGAAGGPGMAGAPGAGGTGAAGAGAGAAVGAPVGGAGASAAVTGGAGAGVAGAGSAAAGSAAGRPGRGQSGGGATGSGGFFGTTAAGGYNSAPAGGSTTGIPGGTGSGIGGGYVPGGGTRVADGGTLPGQGPDPSGPGTSPSPSGPGTSPYPSGPGTNPYPGGPYQPGPGGQPPISSQPQPFIGQPGGPGTSGGTLPGVTQPPTSMPSTPPPTTSVTGAPKPFDSRTGSYQNTATNYSSGPGDVYNPGAGNNVTASPSQIESQANRWEDWAARMAEINAQIAQAASSPAEFGMVTLPASAYAQTQASSQNWASQATDQFTDFAAALNGTASDFSTTEADNVAQTNRL